MNCNLSGVDFLFPRDRRVDTENRRPSLTDIQDFNVQNLILGQQGVRAARPGHLKALRIKLVIVRTSFDRDWLWFKIFPKEVFICPKWAFHKLPLSNDLRIPCARWQTVNGRLLALQVLGKPSVFVRHNFLVISSSSSVMVQNGKGKSKVGHDGCLHYEFNQWYNVRDIL